MREPLKAPFPYFGGKRRVAELVWGRLGDVDNYIEPFCGSAAMLLSRPSPPKIETLNDADCYVANFWRATQQDPERVAHYADGPVNEADLHARHRWLVLSAAAGRFRERLRADPDAYDCRVAGWWCWGLCCWIGGGWCKADQLDRHENSQPEASARRGVHAKPRGQDRGRAQKPDLMTSDGKGHGVHAAGASTAHERRRPRCPAEGAKGLVGVHGHLAESGRRPAIDHTHGHMDGVVAALPAERPYEHAGGRPQLADAYDIGRGVNSNGALGTCAARRAWLLDWFGRLRDRLRTVRVCCGDWLRVCDSESVTTRLGVTGIFLDPPYSAGSGRDMHLYATEDGDVAHAVRAYCLERGGDRRMRLALCGYAGEGHEELEKHGWDCVPWKAQGGYGNRSRRGKDNAARERVWFSPHCRQAPSLFDFTNGQPGGEP